MSADVKVWVRSLGSACRVSVNTLAGLSVILDRLSQAEAFAGLTALEFSLKLGDDLPSESQCSFLIPGSVERTLGSLESNLRGAEGVELMVEPGR